MSKTLQHYQQHLNAAMQWLELSLKKNHAGSSGYISVLGNWSKAYPETTGYIISTFLKYYNHKNDNRFLDIALGLGDWLVNIQDKNGYWIDGFWPTKNRNNGSVFNTGQILIGLSNLYQFSNEQKYLQSVSKGTDWLVSNIGKNNLWEDGNYKGDFNPSYYTRVAWPILLVGKLTGKDKYIKASKGVLNNILERINDNNSINGWGFELNKPAFTHTIAYTIRGFQECARLLNDYENYFYPLIPTLDRLVRKAELSSGYLPGAFDHEWKADKRFNCLTGNSQIALCILRYFEHSQDLRLVNAASKLVDVVCKTQILSKFIKRFYGAVPGSRPIWGKYMMLRLPNWAVKFHADSLMELISVYKSLGL